MNVPTPEALSKPSLSDPTAMMEKKKAEIESKIAEARENAPSNPAEPPSPPPVAEIILDPSKGSVVHLAMMDFNLHRKEIDIAVSRKEEIEARLELAKFRAQEAQKKFTELLKDNNIPEGWSFNRRENGSYMFYPGPARPPRG